MRRDTRASRRDQWVLPVQPVSPELFFITVLGLLPRALSEVWTSCQMALNIPLDPDTSSPLTLSTCDHTEHGEQKRAAVFPGSILKEIALEILDRTSSN